MHRIAVCFAVLLMLSGCTDYKWGHNWRTEAPGGWSDETKVESIRSVFLTATCQGSPLTVGVERMDATTLIALFFIPLFPSSIDQPYPLLIQVKHKDLKSCSTPAQNPLLLKMDGRLITDFQTTRYQEDGVCIMRPAARQLDGSTLTMEINPDVLPCTVAPATLKKSRYACMRATQFGGSAPCED